MNNHVSISRRAALVGLAVAGAALAVPVAAAVSLGRSGGVLEAIGAHKAAVRHMRRIWREVDRLETLPGRPPAPRVFVGNYLSFERDEDGNMIKTPIFSHTHEDISHHCERHCNPHLFQGRPAQAIRDRYDGLHRELTRLIRARRRFDRASGLLEADAAQEAAHKAEWQALAALMVTRPTTEAEAEAKHRYVNRNPITREWWEATDVAKLMHERLMQVA